MKIISACIFLSLLLSENLWANPQDPTQPPGFSVPLPGAKILVEKKTLNLTAIFISCNQKTAIINGIPVDEGEKIGEFRVRKITPYDVTLTGKQGITVLRLFARPVKGISKGLKP